MEENAIRSSLCACCTPDSPEVLKDDAREVLRLPVAEPRLRHVVDKLVVLVYVENAVRRDALHREGTGDADPSSGLS